MTVVLCEFDDTKEFVESVLDFHRADHLWRRQLETRFIYRGISNLAYKLVPSTLRSKSMHREKNEQLWRIESCQFRCSTGQRTQHLAKKAELEVARRFYQMGDAAFRPPHQSFNRLPKLAATRPDESCLRSKKPATDDPVAPRPTEGHKTVATIITALKPGKKRRSPYAE